MKKKLKQKAGLYFFFTGATLLFLGQLFGLALLILGILLANYFRREN